MRRDPTKIESPDIPGGALGPPQFGLRSLFLAIAGLSALFGVMVWAGAVWALVLSVAGVLIAGHILGNSVGTRLRDRSTEALASQTPTSERLASAEFGAKHHDMPPQSTLRYHFPLHRRNYLVTGLCALAGAVLGAWALLDVYPRPISFLGMLVGSLSAAVICGWIGLLVTSFWTVTRRAWREAVEHHERGAG